MKPALPLAILLACTSAHAATDPAQRSARHAVARGSYVALEVVVRDALRRHPGTLLEVELDQDDNEYEVEILLDSGMVMELEYDARSGALLKSKQERD